MEYFISYAHERGIANTEITLSETIKNMGDIGNIEIAIAKKNGFNKVVITNYIQFQQ